MKDWSSFNISCNNINIPIINGSMILLKINSSYKFFSIYFNDINHNSNNNTISPIDGFFLLNFAEVKYCSIMVGKPEIRPFPQSLQKLIKFFLIIFNEYIE